MTAAHHAGSIVKANQLNSLDVGCTWFTRQILRYLYDRVSPGSFTVGRRNRHEGHLQYADVLHPLGTQTEH